PAGAGGTGGEGHHRRSSVRSARNARVLGRSLEPISPPRVRPRGTSHPVLRVGRPFGSGGDVVGRDGLPPGRPPRGRAGPLGRRRHAGRGRGRVVNRRVLDHACDVFSTSSSTLATSSFQESTNFSTPSRSSTSITSSYSTPTAPIRSMVSSAWAISSGPKATGSGPWSW